MKIFAVILTILPFVSGSSLRNAGERELQVCDLTCSTFAECVIVNGAPSCQCVAGAQVNATGGCIDINECDDGSPCTENASCIDYDPPVQYQCLCNAPYIGVTFNAFGPTGCADCPLDCGIVGVCTGTPYGAICVCPMGSVDVNGICVDINECVGDNTTAPECQFEGGYCVDHNPPRQFKCGCIRGYVRSSAVGMQGVTSCVLDQCYKSETNNCSPDATCTNIVGGNFTCACNEDFQGDGIICTPSVTTPAPTPVSSCDTLTCDPIRQVCVIQKDGSPICDCNKYWISPSGFGGACNIDVNECRPGVQSCPDNAECVNIPGKFFCYCKPGWTEKQGTCVDVDECANLVSPCAVGDQVCVNTQGSFQCQDGNTRA